MTPELYDALDGQVVLLAGADGGVGETITRELTTRGATLYVGSADGTAFPDSIPLALEMTDAMSVDAAVGRIVDERGRLDVLLVLPTVADARDWSLLETSVEALDTGIDRGFRGPLLLTRAALPYLLERDGGRIVAVLADSHRGVHPLDPAAQVSMGAFSAFTRYLDEAFSPRLIANSAAPGQARADGGWPDRTEASAETVEWLARFRPGSVGGRVWSDRQPVDG